MQAFCTGKLVSIAPHSYDVSTMLTQMISVGMAHDYLVELVLAVIRTKEQSFV